MVHRELVVDADLAGHYPMLGHIVGTREMIHHAIRRIHSPQTFGLQFLYAGLVAAGIVILAIRIIGA